MVRVRIFPEVDDDNHGGVNRGGGGGGGGGGDVISKDHPPLPPPPPSLPPPTPPPNTHSSLLYHLSACLFSSLSRTSFLFLSRLESGMAVMVVGVGGGWMRRCDCVCLPSVPSVPLPPTLPSRRFPPVHRSPPPSLPALPTMTCHSPLPSCPPLPSMKIHRLTSFPRPSTSPSGVHTRHHTPPPCPLFTPPCPPPPPTPRPHPCQLLLLHHHPPHSKGKQREKPLASLLAGATAGSIEGFVTYPTEFAKTQLQFGGNGVGKTGKVGLGGEEGEGEDSIRCGL